MWEDRAFADPDGVDVDALFEDLHSDDERTQYEAVVGVYWLAGFRPERVRPREDELLALAGTLPDFGLSDSSATRNRFGEGVAELVDAYPDGSHRGYSNDSTPTQRPHGRTPLTSSASQRTGHLHLSSRGLSETTALGSSIYSTTPTEPSEPMHAGRWSESRTSIQRRSSIPCRESPRFSTGRPRP